MSGLEGLGGGAGGAELLDAAERQWQQYLEWQAQHAQRAEQLISDVAAAAAAGQLPTNPTPPTNSLTTPEGKSAKRVLPLALRAAPLLTSSPVGDVSNGVADVTHLEGAASPATCAPSPPSRQPSH